MYTVEIHISFDMIVATFSASGYLIRLDNTFLRARANLRGEVTKAVHRQG